MANDTVYTLEELIDKLHRARGRLSSATAMLSNLKIERDQLFSRQVDAQDVDAVMVDSLTDISTVILQVAADLGTLNANTLHNAIEVRPGQRSNKTGGTVLTELKHYAILYNVGPGTSATIAPKDSDNAAVEAFADGVSQLFAVGDKVELSNAENTGNNGIHTISVITDILMTFNDAIPGGADNTDDETLVIRLIEGA